MRLLGFALFMIAATVAIASPSDARTHSKKSAAAPSRHAEASHHSAASSRHGASSRASHTVAVTSSRHSHSAPAASHVVARVVKGKHGRSHVVYETKKETVVASHHGRHQKAVIVTHEIVKVVKVSAPKTRYAYPLNFFMLHPPEFDRTGMSSDSSSRISRSFHQGYADNYAARSLVRAGLVSYHPLRGGIFWRREPVKYIIMHSTETGIPVSAEHVIESWSSMGVRHPGAQYVVDRDGTIFQAVDPDLGTVHINIFKTLPGINNDNSIGIEMNHTGRQDYPAAQREAVVKLVTYLQERYKIADENVITHRYAQQGDHTDPVNFDWDGFIAAKSSFRNRAIAYKVKRIRDDVKEWNVTTTAVTPDSVTTTTTTVTAPASSPLVNSALNQLSTPASATVIVPTKGAMSTPSSTTIIVPTKGPLSNPVSTTIYTPVPGSTMVPAKSTFSSPGSTTIITPTSTSTSTSTLVPAKSPLANPGTTTIYTPAAGSSKTPLPPVREFSASPVPEASTYLQPHKLLDKPPVYKTTTTTTTVTTSPDKDSKMILVPPGDSDSTPVVAPMVLPKNMPSLRGPIEMAPGTAPGLNIAPTPGVTP
ncbi:MAG TPA: N-acetylmuramoyl-L-alanine amidase [Drouetiella sp.]